MTDSPATGDDSAGPLDPSWRGRAKAWPQTVTFFTRQMSTMLAAGLSLVEALECLLSGYDLSNSSRGDYEDTEFQYILEELVRMMTAGHSFSRSAQLFPGVFPSLYIAMLRVGEDTGGLVDSLSRLTEWLEKADQIRRKVRAALAYPGFMLLITGILAGLLFLLITPQFEGVLAQTGGPLPWPTQLVFTISALLRSPSAWLLSTACLVALLSFLARTWDSKDGRLLFFRIFHATPVLGKILQSASLARYCSAARMSIASGVDMVRTIESAVMASSNPLIEEDWKELREALINGNSLSDHFRQRRDLYDGILILMVAAGEETGKLELSFQKAAQIYNESVDHSIESLSALIEPILLLTVGGLVGVVLIAVALPMYAVLNGL